MLIGDRFPPCQGVLCPGQGPRGTCTESLRFRELSRVLCPHVFYKGEYYPVQNIISQGCFMLCQCQASRGHKRAEVAGSTLSNSYP